MITSPGKSSGSLEINRTGTREYLGWIWRERSRPEPSGRQRSRISRSGACEAENLPGFDGGCSRDRGVADVLQHLTGMAADAGFVIDHENERHDQTYTGYGAGAGASGFSALGALLQASGDGFKQRVYAERLVAGGHWESVRADGVRQIVEVENGKPQVQLAKVTDELLAVETGM
jgi:hypothetical protein